MWGEWGSPFDRTDSLRQASRLHAFLRVLLISRVLVWQESGVLQVALTIRGEGKRENGDQDRDKEVREYLSLVLKLHW